ncbi:hypothetical protein FQZ97_800940 [compost metagenome]
MFASTRVRPCRTVCSASAEAPTTTSHARMASACCVSMRTWFSRSGVSASRTKLSTEPPFCAKPMKSSTLADLPSRCAAIAMTAPTVTTPVPPTPVTSRSYGPVHACGAGCASAPTRCRKASRPAASAPLLRRSLPPVTPTKLGQKPLAQE